MFVRCKLCNMKVQTIQKITCNFREKIQNFAKCKYNCILGARFHGSGTSIFFLIIWDPSLIMCFSGCVEIHQTADWPSDHLRLDMIIINNYQSRDTYLFAHMNVMQLHFLQSSNYPTPLNMVWSPILTNVAPCCLCNGMLYSMYVRRSTTSTSLASQGFVLSNMAYLPLCRCLWRSLNSTVTASSYEFL